MRFATIKLKNILKLIIFLFTLSILFIFSKTNFSSVKESVNICFVSVLPSLFPFILFTELILKNNLTDTIVIFFGNIFSKIFKIKKSATPAIIIGFLCGFPMGAKTVNKLYEENKISYNEAQFLLLFVNNCNPAFIISTIGIAFFLNIKIGILLYISHIISAIIIGTVSSRNIIHKKSLNLKKFNKKSLNNNNINKQNIINIEKKAEKKENIIETLRKSILSSFVTLGTIFGYIIVFNLIFDILKDVLLKININSNYIDILSGIFEVTRGSLNVCNSDFDIKTKICIVSFLLGFNGICIIFQIYSTVAKHNFDLFKIIKSKIIQGIISAFTTYILLGFIDISDITQNVFFTIDKNITYSTFLENIKESYTNSLFLIIFLLTIYLIISKIYKHKKCNK